MAQLFMTTQEVAEFLGIEESTVRYASSAGWLKPVRQGRRNLFPQEQVIRYKHYVAQRYQRKQLAQDLLVAFPRKPPETDGPPSVNSFSQRDWEIFVAYGSDPDASLATVSKQFGFSRQYAQARILRVIRVLSELQGLDNIFGPAPTPATPDNESDSSGAAPDAPAGTSEAASA